MVFYSKQSNGGGKRIYCASIGNPEQDNGERGFAYSNVDIPMQWDRTSINDPPTRLLRITEQDIIEFHEEMAEESSLGESEGDFIGSQ